MEAKNNVHAGHRQRMRKMFEENGFNGMSEHQILEMILFYAYARIDTNEMAHNLIDRFGGLNGVFDASIDELRTAGGMTDNAAVLIKMFPLANRRYNSLKNKDQVYDNTDKLCELFDRCFAGDSGENFYMAVFDNGLRLISNNHICGGGPSSSNINMRKIIQIIIQTNTSLVALSHNHPNGGAEPSDSDVISTRAISSVLSTFGVKILDHIIVGKYESLSMRRLGLLPE